ncbi:geraniol synthase, chloroplastic-like [Nymphaea colorata]|nr:geraniol synthase, chloroplastic-like [Nymphaea colorata]
MATHLASLSTPFVASPKLVPSTKAGFKPWKTTLVRCEPRAEGSGRSTAQRRPSRYQSTWNYDFIQSITHTWKRRQIETQRTRVEELRREVRQIITSTGEQVAQLELIDSLERLGVAYHFESEIRRSLDVISTSTRGFEDMYSSSLRFRTLRQYGYNVSAECFSRFRDQSGRFFENLRKDVRGWWRDLGLGEHISFARDRLVESYFMAVGKMHESQFSQYRMQLARVSYLMATVEDIFGEHQSVEELERFVQVVERWDLQATEQLPQSLRVFCAAVYNTTNQISYTVLRRHGHDITSHMRRWVSVCRAYLVEAMWHRA